MAKGRMVPCPHCGKEFREGRNSCPHCGADRETGWQSAEELEAAEVDLNFTSLSDGDYELFLQSEGLSREGRHEPGPPGRRRGLDLNRGGALAVLIVILILVIGALLAEHLG